MEHDNKKDDERRAALWPESDSEITHRGHVTLDGEKKYAVLVKSYNNKGEEKRELMVSTGLVYQNEQKLNEQSPDLSGKVKIDGRDFRLALWEKTSRAGAPYLQGQVSDPKEQRRGSSFPE